MKKAVFFAYLSSGVKSSDRFELVDFEDETDLPILFMNWIKRTRNEVEEKHGTLLAVTNCGVIK